MPTRLIACTFAAVAMCMAEDDPALWLRHPAVSPDGASIAFAHAGQIWLVPSAGGDAVPLTDGSFYSFRPVWSPDGSRLAFASMRFGNADVFVMPVAGGAPLRLTWNSAQDIPQAFSPDGRDVFVASNRLGDAQADAQASVLGLGANLVEQLYAVPVSGGRPRMVLATTALDVHPSRDGKRLLYTDHPSIENEWRKHHVSDAARDVWQVDLAAGTHQRLTDHRGEDRNAVYGADGAAVFWLSERGGSFNVWTQALAGGEAKQVTAHQTFPVRFLSTSLDGGLVYGWNGEIWKLPVGATTPQRVPVRISQRSLLDGETRAVLNQQATELAVSPKGGELALIVRGDVFVVSPGSGATRRITSTPAWERSVSFSPDGRSLLYASERSGTWDIIEATLRRPEDTGFAGAAPYVETVLVGGTGDSFQPVYDPAGKRIAYREDRNSLRVHDLAAKTSIEVLGKDAVYSYADEDLNFAWSPDGRWLVTRTGFEAGNAEIELIDAAGRQPRRNVSQSGFMDIRPSVSADGSMILWLSDRMGHRATDASAEELHVFGAFLTQEGLDVFRATPEERARRKPAAAAEAPDLPSLEGLPRRTLQLSQLPADVLFYRLAGDGRSLIVVSGTPAGLLAGQVVDIASQHARQLFVRPPVPPFVFTTDPAGTAVYALGAGGIDRYDLASGQSTTIRYSAEFVRDARGEIAAIFEHAWRLTQSKFYDATMHGVDWVAMGANYRRFLPRVQHWEELAEILSEMVGELNASHQGASYLADTAMGDATGSLGVYYDGSHRGPGQRIAAILPGGPADRPDSALRPGAVVMAVDGVRIGADDDISRHLNRTAGRPVLLAIKSESGPEVEQIVTPISPPAELALAYARWVERRRALVDRLSQGRLGYIHIPHMNVDAYRQAYSDLFGRHRDAEGVVVDIRHNGGGNLHDQLLVMLSGEHHSDLVTRYGAVMGRIPGARWAKPSAVVANAASYSDGSVFPALYQRQALGPIIGERVPGTGTAVLWERQLEPRLIYGVPQIGFRFRDGTWFENREIVPDVLVRNDPAAIAKGGDPQLEAAVAKLLATLKK